MDDAKKDLLKEAKLILKNYEKRHKIKRFYRMGRGEIWLLRVCLLLSILLLMSVLFNIQL